MKIIHLPREDELAYNLNKLPQTPDEYAKSMKSLAYSVIDYSKQIEQLFGVEESKVESGQGEENGQPGDNLDG